MRKYVKALAEKSVSAFTIQPIGWSLKCDGVLKKHGSTVMFQISNGFDELNMLDLNTQKFEILFKPNLSSFQVQHRAMDFMSEHRLFQQLIRNAQYELECPVMSQHTLAHKFR